MPVEYWYLIVAQLGMVCAWALIRGLGGHHED